MPLLAAQRRPTFIDIQTAWQVDGGPACVGWSGTDSVVGVVDASRPRQSVSAAGFRRGSTGPCQLARLYLESRCAALAVPSASASWLQFRCARPACGIAERQRDHDLRYRHGVQLGDAPLLRCMQRRASLLRDWQRGRVAMSRLLLARQWFKHHVRSMRSVGNVSRSTDVAAGDLTLDSSCSRKKTGWYRIMNSVLSAVAFMFRFDSRDER